jgi:hypothetical protein
MLVPGSIPFVVAAVVALMAWMRESTDGAPTPGRASARRGATRPRRTDGAHRTATSPAEGRSG